MKALLTIAAAVLFAGTVLQAQTVQESKARYTVMMETRVAGGLTGNGDYEALEWTVAPGCTFFDRLSLRVPVELDVAMFPNAEPQRTYCMTGTLGLNVGYDLLGSERYLLELNASGGSTYIKTSANYAYADLSLKFGAGIGRAVPYLGLGLRYYHPYSNPDVILTRTLALTATFGVLLF